MVAVGGTGRLQQINCMISFAVGVCVSAHCLHMYACACLPFGHILQFHLVVHPASASAAKHLFSHGFHTCLITNACSFMEYGMLLSHLMHDVLLASEGDGLCPCTYIDAAGRLCCGTHLYMTTLVAPAPAIVLLACHTVHPSLLHHCKCSASVVLCLYAGLYVWIAHCCRLVELFACSVHPCSVQSRECEQ